MIRGARSGAGRWRALQVTPLLALVVAGPAMAQTGSPPVDPVDPGVDVEVLPAEPPTAAEVLVMPRPPTHGAPVWQYSEPDPKLWEWIMLDSGEWLKGEITVMREGRLKFDSDELGNQDIDWEDVRELRSPRINSYSFTRRRLAVGRGFVTENEVSVMTGAGIMIFRRDELLAVVPGEQREWDRWHVDASLGVTLRGGNTKQNDLLTQATITRRGPFSRLTLSHRANFGTSDDSETINNQLGNVRVDLFVWDRVFITPFQIEFFRDTFQNIEYRVSPGAGVGYELIEKKWLEWNLEFGAVYRRTQFVSVEFPSSSVDDTFAFSFGTNFDWDITRRLELSGTYSASVAIPKASDTNQHAKAVLSFELTSILDLDVTLIWDRTGDPTPEADGTLPEPDDYVLSVGLAIDF